MFAKEGKAGRKKDYGEALKWFELAAEEGDGRALCEIGLLYKEGHGVDKSTGKSLKYFREAAEKGDAKAQYELGHRYDYGEGVKEDNKEAVKWYRKAAEQNVPQAQFSLGSAYFFGDGVEKDVVRGYAWQTIAVSGDYATPVDGAEAELHFERWKTHHSKMTKEQIDEAKELAKEMIAKNPKLIQRKK